MDLTNAVNMTPKPLSLSDCVRIVRRRVPHILVPFLLVSLGGATVVKLLPSIYRSTAKVSVESQQIPAELVRSTIIGAADERIGFIEQAVMTDARMEEIIGDFGLYQDELATQPLPKVINKFRENTTVQALLDPYARSRTAIAFTVSFDHTDPNTARDVATTLVDLFLKENTKSRSSLATGTAAFLRQQAEKLSERFRAMDQRVAEYKRKHSDALPEHLDLRVSMLQQVEFDIRRVQREIAAAEQERRLLETQRDTIDVLVVSPRGVENAELTPQQRLRALKADLANKSAFYADIHPDLIRLKRMIATAENEVRKDPGVKANSLSEPASNPEFAQMNMRIAATENRLALLKTQEQDLSAKLSDLQSTILKTPEVERGLKELTFDYDSAVEEYQEIRDKQQQAELAENLETNEMAERFVLLETPTVPVSPVRPDRLKLMALCIAVALGSGGALAFAAELVENQKIRDPFTLSSLLGARPLATLPYIELHAEGRQRIIITWLQWSGFFIVLAGIAFVLHQQSELLQLLLQRLYY